MSFGDDYTNPYEERLYVAEKEEDESEVKEQLVGFVIKSFAAGVTAHVVYVDKNHARFDLPTALFFPPQMGQLTKGQAMKVSERLTLGESIRFSAHKNTIIEFTRLEKKDSDFPDTKVVNNFVYKKTTCVLKKPKVISCYCHLFGKIVIPGDLSDRLMENVDFEAWVKVDTKSGAGSDQNNQLACEVAEVIGINIHTDILVLDAPWTKLKKKEGKDARDPYGYDSDDAYEEQVERTEQKFADGETFDPNTEIRKKVAGIFISPNKIFLKRRRKMIDVGFRPQDDLSGTAVLCETVYSRFLSKEIVYAFAKIEGVPDVPLKNGKFFVEVTLHPEMHGYVNHSFLGVIYDRYQILGVLHGTENKKETIQVSLAPAYRLDLKAKEENSPGCAFIIDRDEPLEDELEDCLARLTDKFENSMTKLRGYVFGKQVYCPDYGNLRFDLAMKDRGRFRTGTLVNFEVEINNGIYYIARALRTEFGDEGIQAVDTKHGPAYKVPLVSFGAVPEMKYSHLLKQLISDPDKRIVERKAQKGAEKKGKGKGKNEPKKHVLSVWVIEDASPNSVTRFKALDMNEPMSVTGADRFDYDIRESFEPQEASEWDRQSLILSRVGTAMSVSVAPSRAPSVLHDNAHRVDTEFPVPNDRESFTHSFVGGNAHRSSSPSDSMTLPALSPTPSSIIAEPAGDFVEEEAPPPLRRQQPSYPERGYERENGDATPSGFSDRGRQIDFEDNLSYNDQRDYGSQRSSTYEDEDDWGEQPSSRVHSYSQPPPLSRADRPQHYQQYQQPHRSPQNQYYREEQSWNSDPRPQENVVASQPSDESLNIIGCPSTEILQRLFKNKEVVKLLKEKDLYFRTIHALAAAKSSMQP